MTKQKIFKSLFIMLAATLISSSAFAQLSLSAKAGGKADTKKGAKADAKADTKVDAETSSDTDVTADSDALAADSDDSTLESADNSEIAPPAPIEEEQETEVTDEETPAVTTGTAGYDKGFYIKSDDDKFLLRIHGMTKIRFNYYNDEFAVVGDDGTPGTNHTNHANFSVNYARLHLSGHVFTKKLGYVLYYNFPTSTMVEAFVNWTFIPKKLHIQVGQFKRPISRAYLTSTVKNQFASYSTGDLYYDEQNDNPRGSNYMGQAEDIGIQLSNDYTKAKGLEWAVAIMNGSNSGPFNDFAPVLVGRIGYNNGIKGYSETDFEGGPFRFGIAFSASTEFDHDDDDFSVHNLSLDGMIKVQGLAISAAGYMRGLAVDGVWDDNQLERIGAFVQAGYLIKDMFETMARYGMSHDFNWDNDIQEEITAGLNIHIFDNHNLKWTNQVTLFTQREPNGDNTDIETHQDIQAISQLQLFF